MAYLFLGSNKITLADFGYKYIYMFIQLHKVPHFVLIWTQSKTMSFHDIRGVHRKTGLHWQELESYQRSIKLNKKSKTKLRTCIYHAISYVTGVLRFISEMPSRKQVSNMSFFINFAVKFLDFNQYPLCPFQGAISHFVDRPAAHLVP